MDKIEILKSLPQEFYETAYVIPIGQPVFVSFQMKYNSKLVKALRDANRWKHEFDNNGFIEFTRDDGIKVLMT